jgi:flagellar hook-length control protein FliK
VHQQLSGAVRSLGLTARGDGTHRILLDLHPADLGQVSIEVSVHRGTLNIAINGATEAVRDTIRTELPQLHAELADAGLGGAGVSLGSGTADQSGAGGQAAQSRPGYAGDVPDDPSGHDQVRRGSGQVAASGTSGSGSSAIDRWL